MREPTRRELETAWKGGWKQTSEYALPSTEASKYAKKRAAELVKGVENATRLRLRQIVTAHLKDEKSTKADLRANLKAAFGPEATNARAELIARTEVSVAANKGNLAGYGSYGTTHVYVHDGTQSDGECRNADGAIWTLADAENNPIQHPNCGRSFSPVPVERGATASSVETPMTTEVPVAPAPMPSPIKVLRADTRALEDAHRAAGKELDAATDQLPTRDRWVDGRDTYGPIERARIARYDLAESEYEASRVRMIDAGLNPDLPEAATAAAPAPVVAPAPATETYIDHAALDAAKKDLAHLESELDIASGMPSSPSADKIYARVHQQVLDAAEKVKTLAQGEQVQVGKGGFKYHLNHSQLAKTPKGMKAADVQRANEKLELMLNPERAEVRMRIDEDILRDRVLKGDGRFKNQFETNSSNGYLSHDTRGRVEQELFHIPPESDALEHPIYGYVSDIDTDARAAGHYGNVIVRFKEPVRERTTVTLGDSLDEFGSSWGGGTVNRPYPSPINKPSIHSLGQADERAKALADGGRLDEYTQMSSHSYWEAQFQGGLGIDDVEEVILRSTTNTAERKELIDLLEKKGIKHREIQQGEQYEDMVIRTRGGGSTDVAKVAEYRRDVQTLMGEGTPDRLIENTLTMKHGGSAAVRAEIKAILKQEAEAGSKAIGKYGKSVTELRDAGISEDDILDSMLDYYGDTTEATEEAIKYAIKHTRPPADWSWTTASTPDAATSRLAAESPSVSRIGKEYGEMTRAEKTDYLTDAGYLPKDIPAYLDAEEDRALRDAISDAAKKTREARDAFEDDLVAKGLPYDQIKALLKEYDSPEAAARRVAKKRAERLSIDPSDM